MSSSKRTRTLGWTGRLAFLVLASALALTQVVVTSPLLNVRTGPGCNSPVTSTVQQGFVLTVYGQSPGWL